MQLVRYRAKGQEKPAIIDSKGMIRCLDGALAHYGSPHLLPWRLDVIQHIATINTDTCKVVGDIAHYDSLSTPSNLRSNSNEGTISAYDDVHGLRLGSCVGAVGKVVCVGLNYVEHAKETESTLPSEPLLFMKATSSICGPFDPLVLPIGATAVDWEVELAVVIGKTASNVKEKTGAEYISGYCVGIDFSERNWQKKRGGQFTKGKSADGFCPLGPWLFTADSVPNPHALDLSLAVNNSLKQKASTQDMVFYVPYLIEYISQFMTLHPGDVIMTGTPSGVGLGMDPPTFLRQGDVVTSTINDPLADISLGTQHHRVLSHSH